MNEHDHFSNVLDVDSHEEPLEPHFDEGSVGIGADEGEGDVKARRAHAPRKKSIPTPLLLVGGMAAFIVLGAGYSHFFGNHRQSAMTSATQNDAPADNGEAPLPGGNASAQQGQGGMLGHSTIAPPLPSQMPASASEPIGPVPSPQSNRDMFAAAPSGTQSPAAPVAGTSAPAAGASFNSAPAQSAGTAATPPSPASIPGSTPGAADTTGASGMLGTSSTEAVAGTGSTPANAGVGTSSEPSAATNVTSAPDPKDVEIAKLQAELNVLRAHGHAGEHPRHVAKHMARAAHIVAARAHAGMAASASAAANADPASDAAARTGLDSNESGSGGNATSAAQTPASESVSSTETPSATRPVKSAGKRHHLRYAQRAKHHGMEVLVGYRIKQVVPGQGWVEDEATGKQKVVAVGDTIGTAKVVRIDPDNYRIVTTAGVIQ